LEETKDSDYSDYSDELNNNNNKQEDEENPLHSSNYKNGLQICKYGEHCYRRNPDHLKRFYHPPKSGLHHTNTIATRWKEPGKQKKDFDSEITPYNNSDSDRNTNRIGIANSSETEKEEEVKEAEEGLAKKHTESDSRRTMLRQLKELFGMLKEETIIEVAERFHFDQQQTVEYLLELTQ